MSLGTETKDIITVPKTNQRFRKGEFLGKGGFGRCYEFIDTASGKKYAGKVVSKSLLVKEHHRAKMTSEIAIHKTIEHPNIVKFVTNFENEKNVYIVLELCSRKSLFELQKRRRYLTEPEVRYFMSQVVAGCKHLHDLKIIHRDLKLANIFIDEDLNLKLGDFGLATQIEHDGERKRTLCGTPNYIAPEILKKIGHSFSVDTWSIGCIMYTLLVGKPPFETESLHETYRRIKDNRYSVPTRVSDDAQTLILKLLNPNPDERPSMAEILSDPFFVNGFLPEKLPHSCLVTVPNFSEDKLRIGRKPFNEVNQDVAVKTTGKPADHKPMMHGDANRLKTADKALEGQAVALPKAYLAGKGSSFKDKGVEYNLVDLLRLLKKLTTGNVPQISERRLDENLTPSDDPVFWVSKWVDYSDKYGFGYQITDGSHGVFFNDGTRFVLARDRRHIQHVTIAGKEEFKVVDDVDTNATHLKKKLSVVNHFIKYMDEKLVQAGENVPNELDSSRLPYMYSWARTDKAICLFLNNGVVQINFFQDHRKLVLCPKMECVSFLKKKNRLKTYRISDLMRSGCTAEILTRLEYAHTMIGMLTNMTQK